ncbi:unnamed protein product, partial [Rotaria sp. Silwood2]
MSLGHHHSRQHQQQHHYRRSSSRYHRRERKVSQIIEISKDIATSNIEVSIKSEGPIDTKIVLDPSMFGLTTAAVPSPSSPSSPIDTNTTPDRHTPLIPLVN